MSDSVYHFFTITMDIKNLTQYGLVQDMLETINVIQKFNPQAIVDVCKQYLDTDWLILTGEGSSRIFPAKMMIHQAMLRWYHGQIITQWARQLMEYDIQDYTICALSKPKKSSISSNILPNLVINTSSVSLPDMIPCSNSSVMYVISYDQDQNMPVQQARQSLNKHLSMIQYYVISADRLHHIKI